MRSRICPSGWACGEPLQASAFTFGCCWCRIGICAAAAARLHQPRGRGRPLASHTAPYARCCRCRRDQVGGNTTSTTYRQTGQHYAGLNGFTIPLANTCLMTATGDNCDPVRAVDARPIHCSTPPCVVVEITQDTFQWLSTKASFEPDS